MNRYLLTIVAAASLAANVACTTRSVAGSTLPNRTITVAESGDADVVGSDSTALQKAADMLRSSDTLVIAPGTYQMDASLLIPSNVTVRGTAGKTILMKSRGVESALIEDGDYGESYLSVAEPEKFHPGMEQNLNLYILSMKMKEILFAKLKLKSYGREYSKYKLKRRCLILCIRILLTKNLINRI